MACLFACVSVAWGVHTQGLIVQSINSSLDTTGGVRAWMSNLGAAQAAPPAPKRFFLCGFIAGGDVWCTRSEWPCQPHLSVHCCQVQCLQTPLGASLACCRAEPGADFSSLLQLSARLWDRTLSGETATALEITYSIFSVLSAGTLLVFPFTGPSLLFLSLIPLK